jgi:hypothetical protein
MVPTMALGSVCMVRLLQQDQEQNHDQDKDDDAGPDKHGYVPFLPVEHQFHRMSRA